MGRATGFLQHLLVALWVTWCAASTTEKTENVSYVDWLAVGLPNPRTNALACGRSTPNASRVCNPDHVLNETEADMVDQQLGMIATSKEYHVVCGSGEDETRLALNMVVFVVAQLHDFNQTSADRFAAQLRWMVFEGNLNDSHAQQCNNSLAILLFASERYLTISVAEGGDLQNTLSPAFLPQLRLAAQPFLDSDQPYQALNVTINSIASRFFRPYRFAWLWILVLVGSILVLVVSIGWCLGGCRCWCCRPHHVSHAERICQMKVELIKKAASEEQANVSPTCCPLCLEEFDVEQLEFPCGHRFDKRCLLNHFLTACGGPGDDAPECPVCAFSKSAASKTTQAKKGGRMASRTSPAPVSVHVHSNDFVANTMTSNSHGALQPFGLATPTSDIPFRIHQLHQFWPWLVPKRVARRWTQKRRFYSAMTTLPSAGPVQPIRATSTKSKTETLAKSPRASFCALFMPWCFGPRDEYKKLTIRLEGIACAPITTQDDSLEIAPCPICTEGMTFSMVKLGCSHVFCTRCVWNWHRCREWLKGQPLPPRPKLPTGTHSTDWIPFRTQLTCPICDGLQSATYKRTALAIELAALYARSPENRRNEMGLDFPELTKTMANSPIPVRPNDAMDEVGTANELIEASASGPLDPVDPMLEKRFRLHQFRWIHPAFLTKHAIQAWEVDPSHSVSALLQAGQ